MDLTCVGKKELLKWVSNLILSNGFGILAIKLLAVLAISIQSYQLNCSKNVRNMIQMATFYEKSQKWSCNWGKPPAVI